MAIIKVDINNVDNAVKKLNQYNLKLDNAIKDALVEINGKVQDKLLENMILYGIDSLKVLAATSVSIVGNKLSIVIGSDYASFMEYGTGIVGQNSPHPNAAKVGWIYDVNDHGYSGWWYPTTEEALSRYPNSPKRVIGGQVYGFTRGQESKPFVYKTWLYATRIIHPIINKHIRRIEVD